MMRAKPLIYLTNLTHINNNIPSTEAIPLNIGYLATYVKKVLKDQVEVKLFNLHLDLKKAVDEKKPDILGFSNYAWNSNLSYHYASFYKEKIPEIIIVMGGPNYSYKPERQEEYLKKRTSIDFCIVGDGEIAFCNLVDACIQHQMNVDRVKQERINGCHYMQKGAFIANGPSERLKDMTPLPSPYLEGVLDKFLEDGFTPIIQTNRGCPFSCSFCCCGTDYYNRIAFFDLQRVQDELEFIAKRVQSPSLHIADSNFGMYSRDYEICMEIKKIQEKHGWPIFINVATGKNSKERILKCVELLGSTLAMSVAVQSTSNIVLKNIKRDNISLSDFWEIQKELRKLGGYSSSDVILPLPGETLSSYLNGIKSLMEADVDFIEPLTALMLTGSSLEEEDFYERFGLITKYRVIPRDFGVYEGTNVVEVEKVCVGTSDLSIDDYLFLRGFHFIIYCYYNSEVFKELIHYLKLQDCSIYDYCYNLLTNMNESPESLREMFSNFLSETKNELKNSENDIYVRYSKDDNIKKLLDFEEGSNLLQKSYGIMMSYGFVTFLEYGFDTARKILAENKIQYSTDEMESIYKYIYESRSNIFEIDGKSTFLEVLYNVCNWKEDGYKKPLSEYKRKMKFEFYQTEEQKEIIKDYIRQYGGTTDGKGKILTRVNPKSLFREIKQIK